LQFTPKEATTDEIQTRGDALAAGDDNDVGNTVALRDGDLAELGDCEPAALRVPPEADGNAETLHEDRLLPLAAPPLAATHERATLPLTPLTVASPPAAPAVNDEWTTPDWKLDAAKELPPPPGAL